MPLTSLNPTRWSWRALLIAGLGVYTIAAFASEGYYHLDEHFQLLEFANYKLGATPAADLPWEFQAQIRPTLQPVIALEVIKSLRAIGMKNPFTQALMLRLLSGWLAILVFARVSRTTTRAFASESRGKLLLATAIFVWFMPYLSVRFSSENWSALALLTGISLLPMSERDDNAPRVRHLMAGLLLGLSLVFRFQIAFALLGIAAWLIARRQVRWTGVVALLVGGAVAVAIGTATDSWFYGHFVFTPWRYFDANILQGKAAEFGVSPSWFYLPAFLLAAVPPISILLVLLAGCGAYRTRAHAMTWAFASFALGHVIVGHKELRFLFPMAFPLLWLAANGWEAWPARGRWHSATRWFCWTAFAINAVALVVVCTRPALQFLPAWRFLYDASRASPVTVYAEQRSPYDMERLKPHFYDAATLTVRIVPNLSQLDGVQVGDLVLQRHLAPPPVLGGFRVERVFRAFPDWLLRFNVTGWVGRTEIWSIYRVSGPM